MVFYIYLSMFFYTRALELVHYPTLYIVEAEVLQSSVFCMSRFHCIAWLVMTRVNQIRADMISTNVNSHREIKPDFPTLVVDAKEVVNERCCN
jgi:hypothetical protein